MRPIPEAQRTAASRSTEGEGGARRRRPELRWRRWRRTEGGCGGRRGRNCAGGGRSYADGGRICAGGGENEPRVAAAEMGSGLETQPLHVRFPLLFSPKFHFSRSGIPARSGRFSLIFFASARGSAAFQFLARLIAAYRVMVRSGRNRSGEAPMRLILRFPQCSRLLS